MDMQKAIDAQYEAIESLKQKLSEDHYMNPGQEDELEELIAKAIKFGELCAQRDSKASAVPDGYVFVPKEPTAKMIDATWDYDDEIQEMSHNARNKFIYKAMIEAAQEPAND